MKQLEDILFDYAKAIRLATNDDNFTEMASVSTKLAEAEIERLMLQKLKEADFDATKFMKLLGTS